MVQAETSIDEALVRLRATAFQEGTALTHGGRCRDRRTTTIHKEEP